MPNSELADQLAGNGLVVGTMDLLETIVASGDATVEFTTGIDDTYDQYVLEIISLIPSVDSASLFMRTSSDGGVTWDSAAGDYANSAMAARTYSAANQHFASHTNSATYVTLNTGGLGNASGESYSCQLRIVDPSNPSIETIFYHDSINNGAAGTYIFERVSGMSLRLDNVIVNGLQFYMNSGVITSGKFKLYGVR